MARDYIAERVFLLTVGGRRRRELRVRCSPMGALLRKLVVAVILVVWLFPGANPAQAAQARPATPTAPVAAQTQGGAPATAAEIEQLTQREQQAQDLQRFEGGGRVSISTTALIIVLLLIIIIIILL
jgi:hypothetical protein